MPILLAAIHGILTRQTDPSWPDKLDAWMAERDPQVKVLKKEYVAGPFPRWNCWVKDPLLARGLANEIELFLNGRVPTGFSIWFVAHSNGAVIALLAARRLIVRGHRIGGLILTGAACEADVERNGIMEWRKSGLLGAGIAYCSEQDEVLDGDPRCGFGTRHSRLSRLRQWLWGKLMWPYGCLGRTGWLFKGWPLSQSTDATIHESIFTRWFAGGHSAYFASKNIESTFEQICEDVKSIESLGLVRRRSPFKKGIKTLDKASI